MPRYDATRIRDSCHILHYNISKCCRALFKINVTSYNDQIVPLIEKEIYCY